MSTNLGKKPDHCKCAVLSKLLLNVLAFVDRPLEVIGHNGKAYNITMEPGDMVRAGI
jgi:hypothetical protein